MQCLKISRSISETILLLTTHSFPGPPAVIQADKIELAANFIDSFMHSLSYDSSIIPHTQTPLAPYLRKTYC